MSYITLGALASFLGFWGSSAGARFPLFHAYPTLFVFGMALTGMALLIRRGKRSHWPEAYPPQRSGTARYDAGAAPAIRGGEQRREAERVGDAALLGHEMKNYLCTLRGNARLLRQRVQGTDNEIIDRIDRVVEKLESFTRNMEKAPDATASGVLWRLHMGDAAKACVKTHFYGETEGFRWDIQDSAPTLLGDPDRLEQVFLNLYANAMEADAREVITSLHRAEGALQLRIEDDGRGCAPEDLGRIFEPFFTTKSGPTRRGLGMFIVQSIVENHGGRIRVESKNGSVDGAHGLVFTLDFPLSPEAPGAPEALFHNRAIEPSSLPWLLPLPKTF